MKFKPGDIVCFTEEVKLNKYKPFKHKEDIYILDSYSSSCNNVCYIINFHTKDEFSINENDIQLVNELLLSLI